MSSCNPTEGTLCPHTSSGPLNPFKPPRSKQVESRSLSTVGSLRCNADLQAAYSYEVGVPIWSSTLGGRCSHQSPDSLQVPGASLPGKIREHGHLTAGNRALCLSGLSSCVLLLKKCLCHKNSVAPMLSCADWERRSMPLVIPLQTFFKSRNVKCSAEFELSS